MFSNIPLLLTWLRIVLIPVFVAVYYLPDAWLGPVAKNWTAMSIFAVAATTDWLDGYLARRWGEVSAFGAFLDPVADKLMVAAALIVLVWIGRAETYLAIVIIGREIAISALREWMAQLGQTKSIAVAFIGKVKTVAQMTAIIALLLWEDVIPGVSTPLLGRARAVGGGDPDALVDVPLPEARGAAHRWSGRLTALLGPVPRVSRSRGRNASLQIGMPGTVHRAGRDDVERNGPAP